GEEQTRTMALPRSTSELAERLLEAVDEVSRDDAYASESATPLGPGKIAPQPAGAKPAQGAGEASARSDASAAPPPDHPPDLVAPARAGASVALAVGGDSEIGPATPATRLGPHAGVEAVIDAAVFDANLGLRWALDAPEGLSVRVVDVALLAGLRLG